LHFQLEAHKRLQQEAAQRQLPLQHVQHNFADHRLFQQNLPRNMHTQKSNPTVGALPSVHISHQGNLRQPNRVASFQSQMPVHSNIPLALQHRQPQHLPQQQAKLPIPSPVASKGVSSTYSSNVQAALAGLNGMIYQVQFKCAIRNYILGAQAHPSVMIGDFVVVEADRGEDIGVVVEIIPMKTFVERRIYMKNNVEDENVIGRILRLASVAERQFLSEKFHDEDDVVQFCRELGYSTYRLPMMIHDVEYQFDRHKLTIYYSSEARVDFREFVRDLFSAYKARIWMKKISVHKPIRIDNWASIALATGMQFSPDQK
jgi:hypothetical protein